MFLPVKGYFHRKTGESDAVGQGMLIGGRPFEKPVHVWSSHQEDEIFEHNSGRVACDLSISFTDKAPFITGCKQASSSNFVSY